MSGVQTDWLKRRMADCGYSQRQLALKADMDPSVLNRLVLGKRPWRAYELALVASCLNVNADELLRRTGTQAAGAGAGETRPMVPIMGTAAPSGLISERVAAPRRVERPAASATDVIGIRASHPGHWHDGYVYFYVPCASVDPEAMRALSVCQTARGDKYLGFIDKGRSSGTYRIVPVPGVDESSGEEMALDWAAPVLWVKTR